jgi:2,4-dienoyl-CoA reductase-like NADH-dependent reductase (Old Yellow Enzyme family)
MIETSGTGPFRQSESPLAAPLTLPNGAILANRIAKAAMTEQLASRAGQPTDALVALYQRWAHSAAGLLITGNAVVDREQLVEPYNIVVDENADLTRFEHWAAAARNGGAHAWLQLNHPGRQALRAVTRRSVAPSARRTRYWFLFAPPRALTADEIRRIVERFGQAASIAQRVGFTGVQVHAAHGFLVSQFLSPLSNDRTDEWGGSLKNRMRFLVETVRSIRAAVASSTAVSVKLNSSDFQRGGFTFDEALAVVAALNREGVDLLEITGGNYESPRAADDVGIRRSTREREAFFLDYATEVRKVSTMPVMLTGGMRNAATITRVVANGQVDVVGLARAMAVVPDLPDAVLGGGAPDVPRPHRRGIHAVDLLLESPWHSHQLHRMSRRRDPRPHIGPARATLSLAATRIRWRLGLER